MGVVIPFPADQDRRRPRRGRRWVAAGVLVAALTLGGVTLAGRDLLRGAQAGPAEDRPATRVQDAGEVGAGAGAVRAIR
jgi:hypothetical protein